MKKSKKCKETKKQRIVGLNLKNGLTLTVGIEVFISVMISFGIAFLLKLLFPSSEKIPLLIQVAVYSLIIATVFTRIISKLFFDPIKKLREAMKRVGDGDFSVKLDIKSRSREVREIYQGFNMMTGELRATEILQTDFVSNVSHEFKTPINAIEGYATLLQSYDSISDEEKEYVEKILFNTKRLSSLVGNILLLSKIENQTIQTNKTKFRVDEQIRCSILALESAWEDKDIEFDVEMEKVEYLGSESLMHHIWDNLISNAIKFNPRGGLIKINLTNKDGRVVFMIEDRGPGLSEKAMKHMFDKFYQDDSSHKEEGNGLGLALVKRIVSIMDGEIHAENLSDTGCRFIVSFDVN